MIDLPRTREEAEAYRYHRWAGAPAGHPYRPNQCAYEIWQGFHSYQCLRKPGHGPGNLYCKQHAKILAERERSG